MVKPFLSCMVLLSAMLLAACVPNYRYPSRINQFPVQQTISKLYNEMNTSSISSPSGLPSTFSEFKQRCRNVATSPEGAAKMYFDAVFCYLEPQRRAEASKMLRYIMHADAGWESSQHYATFVQRMRNSSTHYIFRSFAAGTSPENGYRMSPQNYQLVYSGKSYEPDYVRVFLISSGSDSRRMLWVKQYDDGLWYVINNADSYMKVREPVSAQSRYSHDADYDNARVR